MRACPGFNKCERQPRSESTCERDDPIIDRSADVATVATSVEAINDGIIAFTSSQQVKKMRKSTQLPMTVASASAGNVRTTYETATVEKDQLLSAT